MERECRPETQCNCDRDEENQTPPGNASLGESKRIGDQHQDRGDSQGYRREDCCAPQQNADSQAFLHLLEVGVKLVPLAHGPSPSFPKYRLAITDSASAAARTTSIAYHQSS